MKQESFERRGPVQRRRAEIVGDENSRLASLLDALDVGVNVQDNDHNILYQNRFFRTLFGDPGGKCFQLYERRDRPCDDCPAAETLRTGRSLQTERPVIDRQGNRRLLVLTTMPLKEWNGKPAVCEVIRDITVQPQSRPPWEISEESYRYLIENVNEGICIVQDGRIAFVNHEAMRMAGSPLDAIIGRPFADFIHPEDRESLRECVGRHLAGETPPGACSHRLVTREGHVRWVELRISLITWKGRPATLTFVHDITDGKRTEEALRQSEERFRGIFENAIEGIFQTRRDGRFVSCNPSLARLLGASSPDALLRDPDLRVAQFYVDPRHREEMLRILLKEGRDVRNFETQFRRLDGIVVWVSINARFSRSADLEPMVDGSIEDISARKSLELQLLHSQKLDAIGTMAGGIAHDFNNILGIIIGYAEIIKSRKLPTTHKARGDLERVLQAALRARDLVKQILNFSRQEERAMRMIEIRPLVKEAVRMLRATLPATIRIRSSIRTENEMILGDPTQVYQVLINLCTNAAHAMRNAVGTLSISLETAAFPPGEVVPHPDLHPG
ncbi:MAG: PAS domain S-box protein, partial [Deltaproteobacteria bacterium]|nr:PAS domain S-box protein [Deltaproteobacteria bacterium]